MRVVLEITIAGDRIAEMRAVADPERLHRLDLAMLGAATK